MGDLKVISVAKTVAVSSDVFAEHQKDCLECGESTPRTCETGIILMVLLIQHAQRLSRAVKEAEKEKPNDHAKL